jgi:chaperonin GroES
VSKEVERCDFINVPIIFTTMAKDLKFPVQPLGDRVVVRPEKAGEEKKLPSGIIIPQSANKERPEQGEVVAVGQGKYEDGKLIPMTVKVGDTVIFSKYGFDEVKLDGSEYYILAESSVLGIIK